MAAIKNPQTLERRAAQHYGCTYAELVALNEGKRYSDESSLARRYFNQKKAAAARGIGWALTFPAWLEIWLESGKLAHRGAGPEQFCMARHGDAGPYAVGNVSIKTNRENSIEAGPKAIAASGLTRRLAGDGSRLGRGRGWTLSQNPHKPYQVTCARAHVGLFATETEAVAAYQEAVARFRALHGAVKSPGE